jgi:hemerythrin
MPFIVWTSEMSMDVKMLDNDHKRLAILINELHDGLLHGRAKEALEGIFEELVAYTRIHFAHEEQLLAVAGSSGAETHKQKHDHEFERILDLQVHFRSATESAAYLEVLDQLKDWLFAHAASIDKDSVASLKTTGVDSILAGWKEPE